MSNNGVDWFVDTELKTKVATEVIKGDLSIEEICRKYNVTQEQAKIWTEIVYKATFGDPYASEEIG